MTKIVLIILLIIFNLEWRVESKAQYVQPLMGGLQVAIPYDIANIWNRPVSLSPFISTLLGLGLLWILFFGVITSPFGYMFGVPSQKYVLGTDGSAGLFSAVLNVAEQWHNYKPPPPTTPPSMDTEEEDEEDEEKEGDEDDNDEVEEEQETLNGYGYDYPYENTPRSNSHPATPILRTILQYPYPSPDFTSSIFQFIPKSILDSDSSTSIPCQQLILCYAHSSLKSSLPTSSLPVFRVFSKILQNVTEPQKLAMQTGLKGNDPYECDDAFPSCPSNGISLLARILLEGLPKWLRGSIILPQM